MSSRMLDRANLPQEISNIYLEAEQHTLKLTLFTRERLIHCSDLTFKILEASIGQLKLKQVEPAVLKPPGHDLAKLAVNASECHAMSDLIWKLALGGVRSELLSEIAGNACYRTIPALNIQSLPLTSLQKMIVKRMRVQPLTLKNIADLLGERSLSQAARLLNALYLQSCLIVSRTLQSKSSLTSPWKLLLNGLKWKSSSSRS